MLLFLRRLLTPRLVDPQRQDNLKYGPFADLTVYLNGPFHLFHQFLHDGHTKPGAVIMGPRALMLLRKRFKNMFFEFLSDPDPGVLDHKPVVCSPTLTGSLFYLNKYGTMGPVIFEGIVDDIQKYLL